MGGRLSAVDMPTIILFLLLLCIMKQGCESALASRCIDCALLLLLLLSRNKISVQNQRSVDLHNCDADEKKISVQCLRTLSSNP